MRNNIYVSRDLSGDYCVLVKIEISFAIRQILHGGSGKTMAHIRLDPPEPSTKPGWCT